MSLETSLPMESLLANWQDGTLGTCVPVVHVYTTLQGGIAQNRAENARLAKKFAPQRFDRPTYWGLFWGKSHEFLTKRQ
jgi:hypothetical protein